MRKQISYHQQNNTTFHVHNKMISKAKYFLDCLILSSAKQIGGEFLPFCYTFYEFKNSANV